MINHPRPEDPSGVKEHVLFMCALYFKMNFVTLAKKVLKYILNPNLTG